MCVTWNTAQHGRLSHPFENRDTIFRVEVVSDLASEFYYCVVVVVNQIAKILGTWCSDTVIVLGFFKGMYIIITQKYQGTW